MGWRQLRHSLTPVDGVKIVVEASSALVDQFELLQGDAYLFLHF